jgi:hypothetical protein
MSAGGGTRTLKLFRARAPKTRAVASFATPACPAIVALSSPTNLSAVSLTLLLFKAREAKIAIRRGLRECKAPHRCWPERLRDRAIDRHSAPNSLGLAAPATGPERDHRACRNAPLSASLACPRVRTAICSASIWATVASHDIPEPGGSESSSTRSTRELSIAAYGNRQSVPGPASVGSAAAKGMRRRVALLQALAVPSPQARSRQEAFAADSTRAVAGNACHTGHRGIRGLIDSDGCRVVANDRGVRSVRYHFSNRSDDIRALSCAALDDLGIPWTQPRWFEVAVYRKAAVARLDEFVGPKA